MKRLPALLLGFFLLIPIRAQALENVRVAYPSMNNSVFCLTIAQKEGYL